jgi:hypothetical protein
MRCPDTTKLEGLAAGRLTGDEADRLREHLDRRHRCREAIRRLETLEAVAQPLEDLPETARHPELSVTSAYECPTQTVPLPPGFEEAPDLSFLSRPSAPPTTSISSATSS